MKVLEKILQEIEAEVLRASADDEPFVMLDDVERIIRSHMEDDGWIPVEEKLPKWGEQALTCDAEGNIHIKAELGIPGVPFGIDENHQRFFPVVAWKPLPEPYRPKEEK